MWARIGERWAQQVHHKLSTVESTVPNVNTVRLVRDKTVYLRHAGRALARVQQMRPAVFRRKQSIFLHSTFYLRI